jgi:predicted neuraminidase
MTLVDPVDLKQSVIDGRLYRPPDDGQRIEAYIPSMGLENHAANLAALPDGDLLCVWFAGTAEGTGDVRIALSRLPHGEAAWTRPVWVSTDRTRSEQNPILFPAPDGALWLLHTAQQTRGCTRQEWESRIASGDAEGSYGMQWTSEIRRRISHDGGHTWGPTETLFDRPGAFCRQPVVVVADGTWLLPMYYSVANRPGHGGDYTVMQRSKNRGRTWEEYPVPGSRGRVHACPIELAPGRLVAFFRSRAADRIYVSRSTDAGRTWTAPERTVLPNNNASIQAVRLASGAIALTYNDYSGGDDPDATLWPRVRYPLTVALSEDEGIAWPYRRQIDISDGFCGEANEELNRRCAYPSILQTGDGAIHVAYSYRGRQCIKYVRFNESWIRGGLDSLYGERES